MATKRDVAELAGVSPATYGISKQHQPYTCEEIVSTLREMRVTRAQDVGYTPSYTRTVLTGILHEISGFRTDYETIREKLMKGILRKPKKRQIFISKEFSTLFVKKQRIPECLVSQAKLGFFSY